MKHQNPLVLNLPTRTHHKMGSLGPEKRTLLQAMDALTAQDPARLYCIQPKSSDISQGWKNISFADMQGAVNHTVSWIQENCTASTGNQPQVLAYMGANDVRYLAFTFACMRLRHTVSFPFNLGML